MSRSLLYLIFLCFGAIAVFAQANPGIPAKTGFEKTRVAPAAASETAVLSQLDVQQDPMQVRVILRIEGEATYHAARLRDPDRIYIDLAGTRLSRSLPREMMAASTLFSRVRIGQPEAGATRVVLDLTQPAKFLVSRVPGSNNISLVMEASRSLAKPNPRIGAGMGPARAAEPPSRSALQTKAAKRDSVEGNPSTPSVLASFRKAAESGDVAAQYKLGSAYLNGRGVRTNSREAARWLRRAAENGLADAQYSLGTLYASGRGVPQDSNTATRWFHQAASQGNAHAQLALGNMQLASPEKSGVGAANAGDALMWIERAAEQGLPEAQIVLSRMYRNGIGIRKSALDADEWLRQAALGGSTEAQYELGQVYEEARSGNRDPVMAYAWFALAASNGEKRALAAMKSIATDMLPAQILEAQKQAFALAKQAKAQSASIVATH